MGSLVEVPDRRRDFGYDCELISGRFRNGVNALVDTLNCLEDVLECGVAFVDVFDPGFDLRFAVRYCRNDCRDISTKMSSFRFVP